MKDNILKILLKPLKRIIKYIVLKLKIVQFNFLVQKQKHELFYFLQKLEDSTLLITHGIGGGTEVYVKQMHNKEKNIFIMRNCTYNSADYGFSIETEKQSFFITKRQLEQVFKCFNNIIVNSLVSYSDLDCIFDTLNRVKSNNSGLKISYLVHDFHAVCPNINLIAADAYCNLDCGTQSCIVGKDIQKWRNSWYSFFKITDKIICFSKSSKSIILKAYPDLIPDSISVVPHDTSFIKLSSVDNVPEHPIHIGIIGNCSIIPKGLNAVRDLCSQINGRIPITFIGTTQKDIGVAAENVFYKGAYKREELQSLVEKAGINWFFFPSVCPETFSYTITELIQMNLPVICFNIGAQGERVQEYEKGWVFSSVAEVVKFLFSLKNDS